MNRVWIVIMGVWAALALPDAARWTPPAHADSHAETSSDEPLDEDADDTSDAYDEGNADDSADEHADEDSVDLSPLRIWEGTIRVKSLNVRGGPGEGYDIVARLKRGDKVAAVDQAGSWVRVIGLKAEDDDADGPEVEAWIHRSFVNLPKDFLAPSFGDAENAFVDWAIERGDLAELSIDSNERLSVVLGEHTDKAHADLIAFEIGCAYRDQLKIDEPVVVTVWTGKGAAAGWIAQVSCP